MKEQKIRFNEFKGEWEVHSLSEKEFTIIAGGDIDKTILKNSGKYPVVANALTNDGILGYYENSYRVQEPAVTVTGRGEVGIAVARHYSFTPVVRLLSIKSMHNVDFLANAINCYKVPIESTGVPQLTTVKLQEYKIPMPRAIEEEDAIAKYITTLDAQISASTSRLASLKQIKAASLQAMFPQEGETVPKLRFKGFEGEWEKVKLGEICTIKKGTQINKSELSSTGNYYVLNGGIDASGYINVYNTEKDTISISEGGNSCGFVNFNIERFWSGGHNYTLQNVSINNRYLFAFLKFREEDIMNKRVGSGLPNIQKNALENFNILFPVNKAEQLAIASFFTNLDRQITLQSQRLEKLKQIKAACLDKMFV